MIQGVPYMQRFITFFIITAIFVAIDYYVYQGIKFATRTTTLSTQRIIYYAYWGITLLALSITFVGFVIQPATMTWKMRTFLAAGIFIIYASKLFSVIFLFIDDVFRLGKWTLAKFQNTQLTNNQSVTPDNQVIAEKISRSDFLVKTALVVGGTHTAAMAWGIISGAHDYRIRRVTLNLKNLPRQFDGMKIGQLSDIHSGSFFNKTGVKGGIEMLMKEKPDAIFFTGDLVNNEAREVKDYIDVFSKVKAPLGVFSTLGNHDYGDYVHWDSPEKKAQNLQDLINTHKNMGWNILMDEHRAIKVDGESIGILGIQNWGTSFSKYGKIEKAYENTQDFPVKLLLSHDPTHWRAQVLGKYKDIDVSFAGHTHGMQYGVEIGNFKWSPVQYKYKEWAGLYEENDQKVYVNRGFGFIGYPGRLGILPEITIFELKKV
jgi:uncharacterized protein